MRFAACGTHSTWSIYFNKVLLLNRISSTKWEVTYRAADRRIQKIIIIADPDKVWIEA